MVRVEISDLGSGAESMGYGVAGGGGCARESGAAVGVAGGGV